MLPFHKVRLGTAQQRLSGDALTIGGAEHSLFVGIGHEAQLYKNGGRFAVAKTLKALLDT